MTPVELRLDHPDLLIGVVEAEGIAPDIFVDTFDIVVEFPIIKGITREAATQQQIEFGLMSKFVNDISGLFYTHLKPKYPDKYRPELESHE